VVQAGRLPRSAFGRDCRPDAQTPGHEPSIGAIVGVIIVHPVIIAATLWTNKPIVV
jgi:hypothetical protein